jgi:probable rRNA maturation factor
MAIALSIEHGPHAGVARAEILRRIRAMARLLQLNKSDISFLLTDDERIHQLNKTYRGKDRPTDVLAFAMREGEFAALAGPELGDVIVSVPTARRQARARRATVLDEVTMLLAHGLLHLLGWDHDTPAKDRRMRAETARLVSAAAPQGPAARRSKGGADAALSQNRSRATRPRRPRKA